MRDQIKRLLKAVVLALSIGLLFLGEKVAKADTVNINEQTDDWIWPSNGVITDLYGTRRGVHKGIDIAAEAGTPIFAVDDGVVSKSYFSETYGNVVFIKHQNSFETVYAHLKSRNVAEGVQVKQGAIIGSMGNTGDSSGVHLHFEIHKQEWTFDKHNAIDPILALGEVSVGKSVAANVNKVLEVSGRANHHYVVQPGDTLTSISRKTSTSVENIKQINHLSSDIIVPKQVLIVQ
ncbi:peptidoglycan DD-metalloendopeptidase family protein [Neobacillus sp. LXY-4]|uniref:peptidoglycan DD-metalloendopeptidase family protein n=1 Tax=Neobacillus sp. LXY-4 TaxID=3379826 RepID=UPI003EE0F0AC